MASSGLMKPTILAFFLSVALFADAGPRIPLPKLSMTQAIEAAQKQLIVDMPEKPGALGSTQMLLVEVQYVSENYLMSKYPKVFPRVAPMLKNPRWFWIVGYVQPVANDVTRTYCVDQSGEIKLLEETT